MTFIDYFADERTEMRTTIVALTWRVHIGQLSTNPSGTCRSVEDPVAVMALASRNGDAVRLICARQRH